MPEDPGCRIQRDVQQERPAVSVALSRAGVTNLRRIISIKDGGKAELFYATLDLFADLSPEQAGVHMSRFSEVVEDLAEGLTRRPFADIESLARRMAEEVVETQEALRAEVHIKAQSPITKQTPVTHRPTEQLYTLVGIAAATRTRTRLLVGVEVNGLTVCPCAQDMVRSQSLDRLRENGYSEEESERILSLLPIASHNQRGRGTLLIGSEQPAARRGSRRHRRTVDELRDLRAAQAPRRALRRRQGAPQSALRGGRGARDAASRPDDLPRPVG